MISGHTSMTHQSNDVIFEMTNKISKFFNEISQSEYRKKSDHMSELKNRDFYEEKNKN